MKTLVTVLISLGLGLALHAQSPAPPAKPQGSPQKAAAPAGKPATRIAKPPAPVRPPAVTVPGLPPGVNPSAPQKPALPATGPDAMAAVAGGSIEGVNWDDQDVAEAYSKYTGKRVLLSSATQNMEIRFVQRGPLTNREAAALLVKVLDMEGFVFVPSGANEVKLLPKAQGSVDAPGSYPEELVYEESMLPAGDTYVSYFMKLKFIKPEEAIRIFTLSVNALDAGTKMAPVPNASGIIITSRASFIRKLINQQKFIDVAAGNVSTSWVQLKYADSEEVATTLNEIMNAQQKRKTTAGVTTAGAGGGRPASRPPIPGMKVATPQASPGGASAAGEDIPVQIVANPRLNKLFIMGRPVDIVFVEGLAREFDAPPNRSSFFKRQLRFVIASDFLQVAADALKAQNTDASSGGQGGARRAGRARNQNRSASSRNTRSASRGSGRGGGGASGVDSVQEFNVSDVPESIVVGKTFIVADNIANSILVQGPPESVRIVSELIDKLDGRPQQVMISTVFGEVSLGNDRDVGVSWARVSNDGVPRRDANGNVVRDSNGNILRNPDPSKRRAGAGSIGNTFADLMGLTTIEGLSGASGLGLNIYGRIKNITGMLRALESHSDFKILSRPTVYTANNRKAVISSGSRIAVPTNQYSSGTTGQSTNIEYRDVLLRFEVVPLINSDEEVTLRISLVNDTVGPNQEVGNLTVPTIGTETISTTVTVPNNATVVLGGLVTETERNTKSGVPVLSRIPGIGRLFSRKTKDVDRRELLIFIQPKIITGEASQNDAQADMERRYDVAKPTKDFARGVLPRKPAKRKSSRSRKAKARGKSGIPAASKRPLSLRYPTRR